ncbi:Hsp70 family protein [Rhodococcus aerolatus]
MPATYFVTVGGVRVADYLDVLDRAGDPVPTADGRPVHVQLAELLASGVLPAGPLVVAHPDAWTARAQEVVHEEIRLRVAEPVRLVRASDAVSAWLAEQHPRSGDGRGTLVVELGTRCSSVTLRDSPVVPAPVHVRTGTHATGESLEHLVLHHVLDGVPGLDRSLLRSSALHAPLRRLREDCTRAVHDLAEDTETAVPVALPGTATVVRLVRAEVEALLAPGARALADDALDLLDAAGLSPTDLDHVVVTGVLPSGLVAEQLSALLGVAVRSEPSPGAAAAGGAALLGAAAAPVEPVEDVATPAPLVLAGAELPGPTRPVFARPAPRAPRSRRRDRVASRLLVTAVVVSAVSLGAVQLSHRGDPAPSKPTTSATSGAPQDRGAGTSAGRGSPTVASTSAGVEAGSAALKLPVSSPGSSRATPTTSGPSARPDAVAGSAAVPGPAAPGTAPAAGAGTSGGSAGVPSRTTGGTGGGTGGSTSGGTGGSTTGGGTTGGGTTGGGGSGGTTTGGTSGGGAPSSVAPTPEPVVTTPPAEPPPDTQDPGPAVADGAVS